MVFVQKLPPQALILTFYERTAITIAVFAIWLSARAPPSDSRTFLGLHLYLAGRCCKNSLSARAPRNVNPVRE